MGREHPSCTYGVKVDDVPQLDIHLWDVAGAEDGCRRRSLGFEISGHNPGSMMFYCPQLKVAVVGDAIFKESIGRTDFPGSEHALLMKNIREQIYSLSDETVLLPGHMGPTTVGHEKRFNPFIRA